MHCNAIQFHHTGGPDVLRWETVSVPEPGVDDVLIHQSAVGLNFIDIYHRTGLYPLPLPAIPGMEGSGTIAQVGAHVKGFTVGQRVAYAGGPVGAYAEMRVLPANHLVSVPDHTSATHAAAILLKGLTARFLVKHTYMVGPDNIILVWAAAGGVGSLICQWAKHLGAIVFGVVGSEEKIEVAKKNGCDMILNYRTDDIVGVVKHVTNGFGVHAVYDSVGKDSFETSIAALGELGLFISYGQASGKIPPFDIARLAEKSLFMTRPKLTDYIADVDEYREGSAEVFTMVRKGTLTPQYCRSYYLRDAASAHRDLEGRMLTGPSVLIADETVFNAR